MASRITAIPTVCSGAHQRKHRWIPLTKGQWYGKCFYLTTSSCLSLGTLSRRRHDMETPSVLPIASAFHTQRTGNTDIDFFFVVTMNKLLNKQPSCPRFDTSCRSCWLTPVLSNYKRSVLPSEGTRLLTGFTPPKIPSVDADSVVHGLSEIAHS